MNRYLLGTCAVDEGQKIRHVIERFNDHAVYDVMVVDDGSRDGALDAGASCEHLHIQRNVDTKGAGFCVRQILCYAKEKGYEAVLFVSGNDKDNPQDVYKLIQALEEGFDFVQGSRYLQGGVCGGAMPLYRKAATRLHSLIFTFLTGKKVTDSTNGFRAIRLSLLDDQRIDLHQEWLERYEMEPYLFYKAATLGYRTKEVPVTKTYPPKGSAYTKMRPFLDWWNILRPLFFLNLRIKQ